MALKAKAPEVKEKRLKMFVYGPAGVGKTTAAIQFPNAYIIDTERGSDFYAETINKSKSVVFQSLNVDEVKEEVKAKAEEIKEEVQEKIEEVVEEIKSEN